MISHIIEMISLLFFFKKIGILLNISLFNNKSKSPDATDVISHIIEIILL